MQDLNALVPEDASLVAVVWARNEDKAPTVSVYVDDYTVIEETTFSVEDGHRLSNALIKGAMHGKAINAENTVALAHARGLI